MTIDKKIPYNDTFWKFLDNLLRVKFTENGLNYNWIYPIKDLNYSLFKRTKKNQGASIDTRILFNIQNIEKEYLGKVIFGKYSQKYYVNTQETDLFKCFPNSDFSKWVKIDELNKTIEIRLN